MTDATRLAFDLPAVRRKKLTVDFDGGNQSSDAGMLLLRGAEKRTGIIARLTAALRDRRDPARILHRQEEIIAARVFGICCGYEDGIDLNRLRHDPAMKMAVGRLPQTGTALASQSTISRFENAPSKTDAARLGKALVDQFTARVAPAHRDIFDIDDTFDAAHGGQQLAFWNALHNERGFQPMHVYHASSGLPVATILRAAKTPNGSEVRTVIKHLTKPIRSAKAWQKANIVWRGDRLEAWVLADELTAYAAQMDEIDAEIAERRTEYSGLEGVLKERKERVMYMTERADMLKGLQQTGTASRASYIEQMDVLLKYRVEMVETEARMAGAAARLKSIAARREAARTEIIRKLSRERAESAVQAASLTEQVRQAENREQAQSLYAPSAGVIEQLAVHTIGDVIPTGQQVMVIVPQEKRLEVRAVMPNRHHGKVKIGQTVRVKVEAFPFTRYGTLAGTISHIAKDAVQAGGTTQPEQGEAAQVPAATGGALVYPVRITLQSQSFRLRGETGCLAPGMSVQADANVGTEPLYEIILKPLRTLADEALREP